MASSLGVGRVADLPASSGRSRVGGVGRWAERLTAVLIAATLIAVWLISGVSIGDISRFLAFEALYVLLPGCLLYVLLAAAPGGPLRVLAVGWPLGYAVEIGAFALTAGLHMRGLLTFLPLIAAAALGPCVVYRRRRARSSSEARLQEASAEGALAVAAARWSAGTRNGRAGGRERGPESLLAAGAIAVVLVLLGLGFFATYPLPEHASSVFYFLDNVDYVSFSAEALHHWPITEPFLAGHPFRYYTGVFMHVAAIKQVMGVSLAVVIFRLLPAMTTLVAMLQFWCLGGLLGRSRWTGPVTVALLVFVENAKLYPSSTKIFGVALFSEFAWSPTYGFGVIFILGLLILFRSQLLGVSTSDAPARSALAESSASNRLALADSPVSAAPALVGLPAPTRPASTGSGPSASRAVGPMLMLVVLALGAGAVKAPALATFVGGLGLYWLWRWARGKADRLLSCCAAIAVACFLAMYFLLLSGASGPAATLTELAPLNFLKYTVFGSFLAAHPGAVPLVGAAVVMCAWKLLPVGAVLWPLWRRGAWSPFMSLALTIFVVGFAVFVLMGSPADNETYFIWYGYLALIPIAAVTSMTLWREVPGSARRAIARVCVVVVVLGSVIAAARYTQTVPRDSPSHPGLTAALYRGLVWVREHTGRCDVLAANTHEVVPAGGKRAQVDSEYFYYSAFTERRVLLESWILTIQGQHDEQPYPALYALNSEATLLGRPAAVRQLAHRGVSYILIDKSHGGRVREPSNVSRLVFANTALDVYRVTTPVTPRGC
jgi:hypothetical protein